MDKIPPLTADGLLPPGDYAVTFDELRKSRLVLGPDGSSDGTTWDSSWRASLVGRAEVLIRQLWACGINDVFLNGSFVEAKDHPNDIDGYFECDLQEIVSGSLVRALNLLDPHKIWTWAPASRRPYRGYPKKQLPMWHQYRVELYSHIAGFPCGIKDNFGNDLEFPAAFRRTRWGNQQKGIVRILQ